VRELARGDWSAIREFWSSKLYILPIVFGLALLDVVFEGIAWAWVARRFKLRSLDLTGALVFLTGKAGLLMPAQLGRLIRPDSMVRMGRATLADCIKAEGSVFVLDSLSVVALLAGLIVWKLYPALAMVAGFGLIAVCLFLGDRIANRLAGTRLDLPRGFWWSWKSWAIVFVEMIGWGMHGVAFFILVADLPGNLTLWDALFYAPGSAVLGVGTGLPGGIGATEGFLGGALSINQVPVEHLALVVTAFRLVTFWLRLPIGWVALAVVRRKAAQMEAAREVEAADADR
jgi:uncharacterized membrane protein YbhN (UPF0104 family)